MADTNSRKVKRSTLAVACIPGALLVLWILVSPSALRFFLVVLVSAFVAEHFLKRRLAGYRMALFRVFATVCILGTLVLSVGYWFRTEASSVYNAQQCETRIEQRCDPLVLQAWATNLLTAPNGYSNGPVQIWRDTSDPIFVELPPGLHDVWKKGRIPSVSIRDARNEEEAYIYLFWGSGMLGHWGMSIGSPTFVPGPSGDKMRMWKPGVYFWRDCH
jgi:hypothetical protein